MSKSFLVLLLCFWVSACASHSLKTEMPAERSFYAMGTTLEVQVFAESREKALQMSDLALSTIHADELRLSTWIPTSELSKVNSAAIGQEVQLSPLLKRDLRLARQYQEATHSAFNPFIGPVADIWGLRTGGRIPSSLEIKKALIASSPDAFQFTEKGIIKKTPGARIEEGGFGKGIALDDAALALRESGIEHAVLNFGGQVTVLGSREAPIEISSPSDRSQTILRFSMAEGSVATSGNSEHGMILKSGKKLTKIGHLLDPRSGKPAPFEGSITVIAPTGVEADAQSKLFVLGLKEGMQWANENRVKVLWVLPAEKPGFWTIHTSSAWSAPLDLSQFCHRPSSQTKEKT